MVKDKPFLSVLDIFAVSKVEPIVKQKDKADNGPCKDRSVGQRSRASVEPLFKIYNARLRWWPQGDVLAEEKVWALAETRAAELSLKGNKRVHLISGH